MMGYLLVSSGLRWGCPPARAGWGNPWPGQDGVPPPPRNRICLDKLCCGRYASCGFPQEDCLVAFRSRRHLGNTDFLKKKIYLRWWYWRNAIQWWDAMITKKLCSKVSKCLAEKSCCICLEHHWTFDWSVICTDTLKPIHKNKDISSNSKAMIFDLAITVLLIVTSRFRHYIWVI